MGRPAGRRPASSVPQPRRSSWIADTVSFAQAGPLLLRGASAALSSQVTDLSGEIEAASCAAAETGADQALTTGATPGEVLESLLSGAASVGEAVLGPLQGLGTAAAELGFTPEAVVHGALSVGSVAGEAIGTLISGAASVGGAVLGQLPDVSAAAADLLSPASIAEGALSVGADAGAAIANAVSGTADVLGSLLSP